MNICVFTLSEPNCLVSKPQTSSGSIPVTKKNGFALVIALGLMAFILLLILSLTIFVQVESRSSSQVLQQQQARQNALLGAMVALGELQRWAGPDQRISARADLLDETIANPFWTGIWHSDATAANSVQWPLGAGSPRWLVSGNNPAPEANNTNDATITIVSEKLNANTGLPHNAVGVPSVTIEDHGSWQPNRFAYWVGDEGVKANIRTAEPTAFSEISPTSVSQLRRLKMPHQTRWEPFFGVTERTTESELRWLGNLKDIELLESFSATNNRGFHDLTTSSKGLLTNVRDGGLKQDLSRILEPDYSANPDYADLEPLSLNLSAPVHQVFADIFNVPDNRYNIPTWGLLRSFHSLGVTSGTNENLSPNVSILPQTATQQGIFPVIGMIEMNFSAKADRLTGEGSEEYILDMTIQPVVTLINPYDVSLAATDYEIRINYPSSGATGGGLIVTNGNRAGPAGNLHPNDILLPRPLHGTDAFGDGEWIRLTIPSVSFQPGEAKIFSLPMNDDLEIPHGGEGIILAPGLNLINFAYRATNESLTEDRLNNKSLPFSIRMRTSISEIQLRSFGNNEILQRVNDVTFNSSSTLNFDPAEPGSNAIVNRIKLRHSQRGIQTTPGTTDDSNSGARWLALYNIRAPFSRKESVINQWVTNPLVQALRVIPDPGEDVYGATPHMGNNAFWGSSIWAGSTHIPLFTIPRHKLISIASLQHSNVGLEAWFPAYAIGNSWASPYYQWNQRDLSYALNERLWDGFFFSGLPANTLEWPDRSEWLNTRFVPQSPFSADALIDNRAAASLALQGAFNLNSTSESAWLALLKSLQGKAVPFQPPGGSIQSEVNADNTAFSRVNLPGADSADRWSGFSSLDESALAALANEIVSELRRRAIDNEGPFRSMAAFVNRDILAAENSRSNLMGLLQTAIDNSGINDWWLNPINDQQVPSIGNRVTGTSPLPQLPYPEAEAGPRSTAAPGFLTQADLLEVLGPILSPRSDTFVIRSFGGYQPSEGSTAESKVWCEMIVQRLPNYVDESDQAFGTSLSDTNQLFGRQFKILSFRWLSEDER